MKLRGANMYQQEDEGKPWYPKLAKKDLDTLAAKGANYVNLSVPGTYDVFKYKKRADFAQTLSEIVAWAEEAKLYVVISFRTGPGRTEYDITQQGCTNSSRVLFESDDPKVTEEAQKKFIEMWVEVARQYQSHPRVVGYDLLVEPHASKEGDDDPEENHKRLRARRAKAQRRKEEDTRETKFRENWSKLAQRIVLAIRKVDDKTPILISPADWGTVEGLRAIGAAQRRRSPQARVHGALVRAARLHPPEGGE